MRPVSDAFLRTVRGSHHVIARARVVKPGQIGVNPEGVEIPIIVDGNVVLDANADIRSTVDITTRGDWPTGPRGLLAPYGNELFVERGITYGSGSREFVSQGYFKIYSTDQDTVPNGPIRLAGRDRMAGIVDARLVTPVEFEGGSSVELVFSVLVGEVYPNAEIVFDFNASAALLTATHVAEQDRYAFLLDVARSRGKVMFWDHTGRLRVQSPPDPAKPVFDVNSGENGVLVAMSRSLDRDGVFNAVVAEGEAPGDTPPVRAVARDMSPTSPTFWHGPFGKVPRFYSSPFIVTSAQAQTAAAAMLSKSLGLPYNVDFTAVPNPALEPLDPIRVIHPAGTELHVLEQLTIPLTEGNALTATTREKTTVQISVEVGT